MACILAFTGANRIVFNNLCMFSSSRKHPLHDLSSTGVDNLSVAFDLLPYRRARVSIVEYFSG